MNVKYFQCILHKNDYYAVDFDSRNTVYIFEDGTISSGVLSSDSAERMLNGETSRKEIKPPDPGPIEDRYL